MRTSINRGDSCSVFPHKCEEKTVKYEKFNLKSYTIKEEDETELSVEDPVLQSSISLLNDIGTDVESNCAVNKQINPFNSSVFMKNVSYRKPPRAYTNLEVKGCSDTANCVTDYKRKL